MKKAVAVIAMFFLAVFCTLSVLKSEIRDDVYKLLYLRSEVNLTSDEKAHTVRLKKGDKIAFGSLFGEPIIWTVIDEDENALIFSDSAVCMRRYDENSSDWESSGLRGWLNGEFLSGENFTPTEKSLLREKKDSKIFLLSKQELSEIPTEKRARGLTASAAENAPGDKLLLRRNVWYWTRSGISTNSVSVTVVTQSGSFYKTLAGDELVGVCPAAEICSEVSVCGGDGSEKNPYVAAR